MFFSLVLFLITFQAKLCLMCFPVFLFYYANSKLLGCISKALFLVICIVCILLLQDSCYQVRLRFAMKLNKGLLSLRLPLEYMSIFSLAANDPVKERRGQVKQFLYANISKRREYLKQHASASCKYSNYNTVIFILPIL